MPSARRVPPPSGAAPSAGGALLVVAAAALWGTTGTARALGPDAADPVAVGAVRLVLGGALLVAWELLVGRRRAGPDGHQRRAGPSAVGRWSAGGWIAPVAGAVGVAAYQATFFSAVRLAGVGLGTAVAIGSAPLCTGVGEWLLTGRRPTRRWWGASTVGIVGVLVLAGPGAADAAGVVLGVGAGAAYAAFALAIKAMVDRGESSSRAVAIVFGAGGLVLVPVLAVADLRWLASAKGLAAAAWLAGPATMVAYLTYAEGLRRVTAATAATLSLMEPLTAAVLGVALLAERPGPAALLGGTMLLVGVVAVVIPGRADLKSVP